MLEQAKTPTVEATFDEPKGLENLTCKQDEACAASVHSEPEILQAGVQKALILRKVWTRTTIIVVFIGLLLSSLMNIFQAYATLVYEPYATSSFRQHSLIGVSRVISNITQLSAFPVIAKLSDVFGRAEMFIFSIAMQVLGAIMYASSPNIEQYAAAGIFDSIGDTAFSLMQQVFVADVTNLANRGFWSAFPRAISNIPALYLGTTVGDAVLKHSTWQWGYGMWAIILPVSGFPLVGTMIVLQRRAAKHGVYKHRKSILPQTKANDPLWKKAYQLLWIELDFMGALLLVAGLSLFLIPLSLTGSFNSGRWKEPSFIAMLILGVLLFIAFIFWDAKFARKPFIPYKMAKDRTVVAACVVAGLDFMSHVMFSLFYPSYMQVAGGYSPGHATRIDNALRASYQVCSVLTGIGMKYTKRARVWMFMGPPLIILSHGIMIYMVDSGYGKNANEAAFVTSRVLNGMGRALVQTPGQVAVQAVLSKQDVAVGTAVYKAALNVGGGIGTSVSGALWRSQLPKRLQYYLPADAKNNALSIFRSIVVAKKYAPASPIREAINQSYRESQKVLAIAAAAVAAPMLIIMFFVEDVRLDEDTVEKNAS